VQLRPPEEQVQPVPTIETSVIADGSVSLTVTVPVVAVADVFETVMV
jgi:hypothetical protein